MFLLLSCLLFYLFCSATDIQTDRQTTEYIRICFYSTGNFFVLFFNRLFSYSSGNFPMFLYSEDNFQFFLFTGLHYSLNCFFIILFNNRVFCATGNFGSPKYTRIATSGDKDVQDTLTQEI